MASIAISEMFSFVARSAWNVSISKDRTYPLKVGLVKGEVPVDLELWRSFWGTLRPVPLPGLVFFLLGWTFLASVDIQYLINWVEGGDPGDQGTLAPTHTMSHSPAGTSSSSHTRVQGSQQWDTVPADQGTPESFNAVTSIFAVFYGYLY